MRVMAFAALIIFTVAGTARAQAPATRPATTRTTRPTLNDLSLASIAARDRLEGLQGALAAEQSNALARFRATPEQVAASQRLADLEQAKRDRAGQAKLDAARDWLKQKKLLEDQAAAAIESDREVQRLRQLITDAATDAAGAKRVLDEAMAYTREAEARRAREEAGLKLAEKARKRIIVKQDGLLVALMDYGVGHVLLTEDRRPRASKQRFLWVMLAVANTSDTRKIDYTSWQDSLRTAAKDDLGNRYKRMSFGALVEIAMSAEDQSVYPGKNLVVVLVFEPPVDGAKTITVTLPGENVGSKGMFTVDLPLTPEKLALDEGDAKLSLDH